MLDPSIQSNGKILSFEKPTVMGVINLNEDSFFIGSRINSSDQLIRVVDKMLEDGADIIDIGAMSSRPGAKVLPNNEEVKTIETAVKTIKSRFPKVFLSIDTVFSETAKVALENGADLINDISAGSMDNELLNVVAEFQVPYILMHMQGTPETMTKEPLAKNVLVNVLGFMANKLRLLKSKGINQIIIDPGIGFGKSLQGNFEIISGLKSFQIFELPILLGVSRKSLIYKTLEIQPENALNGTTVLNSFGLMNGANILRVHDVKEAKEAVILFEKLKNN